MITAGGLAANFGINKKSVFSTVTRVGPNFNSLVNLLIKILDYYKWNKVRLIYRPEGQREVMSGHCHIAANDIHYGFMEEANHREIRLEQDYKKFERDEEILNNLEEYIGLQFAGKFKAVG